MKQDNTPGMLTLERLRELVTAGEIETVVTAFPDLYGRLMGKRIAGDFFLEHVAREGMHACNYLLTVDMDMEPVPGYAYANWELGYGDFHCLPDLSTLRRATWLQKSALVLCDILDNESHTPVAVAPRNILKRQIEAAAAAGYTAMGGSELEYYIFTNSYDEARAAHYHDLKPIGAYIEDYHILQGGREEVLNAAARKHLAQSGVPVEFSKGEWGPGQHELNIRYADLLTMADRHTLYKQCFKDLADQLGYSVTFMAKFAQDLAGSSCHMHVSLWDEREGRNLFEGEQRLGPVACSDEFRWFLGGWMAHVRELMVFYAPTVNSYKRYRAGSWAPTAIAWSYDNRTAGFRVVGRGSSLRIESRVPGADVNPYLAYAAILASGLDGIRRHIEPPDIFTGDVYAAAGLPRVPASLSEAIAAFEQSEFAREAFGEEVVEHYLHFFKTEQAAFDRAVTDWERRRYFEQI
ncbi:MAG: glutamine synthetase [Caldilineae bacterium]|nr:MAG: glutamine synthetase [Caldilineae bacterium]